MTDARHSTATLALLGAAALALAALVLHVSLPAALPASNVAVALAPGNPERTFKDTTRSYAKRGPILTPGSYSRLDTAAQRAPMAAEPFVMFGAKAIAERDSARGVRLLEEARRRNPRQRLARALLLESYIRSGRIPEAAGELAALNRLVADAGPLLVGVMAQLATDPTAFAAVEQTMRGDPRLDAVLAEMVARGAAPDVVLRLAASRGSTVPAGAAAGWQSALLTRLIASGDFDRAHRLWGRFNSRGTEQASELVHNAGFAQSAELPPFNWRLATNETGAAEFTRHNAMAVEYYGRRSGELAGQLLLLPPGRYRLQFAITGNAKGQGSRLVWLVRCAVRNTDAGNGPQLLAAAIRDVAGDTRGRVAEFTVPAGGCAAQWLTLEGVASEFPDNQSVEIGKFAIRVAGGG